MRNLRVVHTENFPYIFFSSLCRETILQVTYGVPRILDRFRKK